jgi:hypothetical protein
MNDLERQYRFHMRRMALGLAFNLAMAAAMVLALFRPGLNIGLLLTPALVFTVASVGLNLLLNRSGRMTVDYRALGRDEWVQANVNRSRKVALQSIYMVQVPLMFFVAYLPAAPTVSTSVVGMAILTMASGGTAFFGTYLLRSRHLANG